jgi:heme/copper-type cytochrome/quinol oxidase subunit 2
MELKWNFADASKLRWGKHTAKLLVVYDNGQRDVPIEGEVTFWVIPWRLIILLLINAVIIFGFFYLLWYVIRSRRRANKKTAAKPTKNTKKN